LRFDSATVFSARTIYALLGLIELAAVYETGTLVQVAAICRRHGIADRYLEQMLAALRKGGYLTSVRGPRGGYQLSRSPELITVAEVEECLDGEGRAERRGVRDSPEQQVIEGLAQRADRARAAVLRSTSLAQLLVECTSQRQPGSMFYI
jgi:Rrf2 family cysteine metabolism transcriptional repressor